MPPSAPTRKRSRAHLDDDDDLDELSPRKAAVTTPLSGGQKKRKLNAQAGSPAIGAISSFGRRISGFLGLGGRKGKENLRAAEEEDELAADGKDIFEIELSEHEDSETPKVNGRSSATGSQRRSGRQNREVLSPIPKFSTKKKTPVDEPKDIYEVEVSDEDADGGTGVTRSTSQSGHDIIERKKSILKEQKRTVGRPRKSDILRKDKALSREAARRRITAEDEDQVDEGEVESPRRRKVHRRESSADYPSEAPPSTSKRGRPKKVSVEITTSIQAVPRGILTPSRHGSTRVKKSVAFEREDTELDLGFKDLPNDVSGKKVKAKATGQSSKDSTEDTRNSRETKDESSAEESDDEQDAACSICSKLSSRKGNEILFCDGCDKAVHQKCYEVPVIPKGDWFCRDCKPDAKELELEVNGEPTVLVSHAHIPAIEGFEDHLRLTQRILLDKLTGQKRIKLRGHDEQMQKVHQVLEQTVLAGEGNSMLVIGSRGCGKSTVSSALPTWVFGANFPEACRVRHIRGFF